MKRHLARRTIADFGAEWSRFRDDSGYYGSSELFEDIVGPLLSEEEIGNRRVAEIGSGTGRIVEMLLAARAAHVTAIEPSGAFDLLSSRFEDRADLVSCHRVPGEGIASLGPFDLIVAIGVLHHIPEPLPVVRAACEALRPGGRFLAGLYGRKGNGLYLALARPLRAVTSRLPDGLLELLARGLDLPLVAYIGLCRRLPLPLRRYVLEVLARMDADKRRLIIFDQLNPAYAKYYGRDEARELFSTAGFVDIELHHRHGYSWTIIGTSNPGRPSTRWCRGARGCSRP